MQEPKRLAETVQAMGLRYCVITSVNRDDLSDGGASIFAACINRIRDVLPECRVEVLIPDFAGNWDALRKVIESAPAVLNHNIESTVRVFPRVRPKGNYNLSLELLAKAKEIDPAAVTKSGIIVGMGETTDEVLETMRDLRGLDCDLLTIGQYLRPSAKHIAIDRFYHPAEFEELRVAGLEMGFKHVASGPLVRSSYHGRRTARRCVCAVTSHSQIVNRLRNLSAARTMAVLMSASDVTLILLNANVLTMQRDRPKAEAVAVAEDRIVAVGSNTDIRRLSSTHTRILDCHGLTLLPDSMTPIATSPGWPDGCRT